MKHVNKETGGRFLGCSRFPRCKNTRDKQQANNFCSNGHARTKFNTAHNSGGSRRCLICSPLVSKSSSSSYRYSGTGGASSGSGLIDTNLYCRNGHRRTIENTYVRPNGERECGICRGRTTSRPSLNDTILYCRNGHRRTIENTYMRPNGARECGICRKNAR